MEIPSPGWAPTSNVWEPIRYITTFCISGLFLLDKIILLYLFIRSNLLFNIFVVIFFSVSISSAFKKDFQVVGSRIFRVAYFQKL